MAAPYYTYGGNLLNREKYTSVVNTAYGPRRYFSSIDTDVYFGDILIDEMVAFDFIVDEKKIPIYGYNNFTPKRLLTGQKTIQGSFAINFTQTFNLKLIIDGLPDSIYANDYEEAMFYCSDDNQALFGKGFDITISYGDARGEGSYNSCTQTLVGCYITSYRQAFDTSGEPILDMYTFVAKDLLIHTDFSNEQVKSLGNHIAEDRVGTEPNKPSDYIIAHSQIEEEMNQLREECKAYPETLGIELDPTYSYTNNKHILSLEMTIYNDSAFEIESDIQIEIGSTTFTLGQVDEHGYRYEIERNVGNKIKKLFEDDDADYIDCSLSMYGTYIRNNTTKEINLLSNSSASYPIRLYYK